jgi:hypothetical protein
LQLPQGDYVIIPTTFEPGKERSFAVSAYSTSPLQLTSFNSTDDWKEASIIGEWKGKTAGGCFSNGSWRYNPKFKLVTSIPTVMTILLSKMDNSNIYIGFYLFKADSKYYKVLNVTDN